MRKYVYVLYFTLLFFSFSCFTAKKVSREVRVAINSDFQVIIEKDPKGHFVDYYSPEEYKKCFIEGITKQLAYKNIFVSSENPEFIISVEKILIQEQIKAGIVKDSLSKDFGKSYDLTVGKVEAYGLVTKHDNSFKYKWSAQRDRAEKLTNLNSASGVVLGEKMGPHDWRKKPFDSFEFRDMIIDLSNKSGNEVTSLINTAIK